MESRDCGRTGLVLAGYAAARAGQRFVRRGLVGLLVVTAWWVVLGVPLADAQVRWGHTVSYPTASYPDVMATGDLDGDGLPDLALSERGGQVQILLAHRDGTFAGPITVATVEPSALPNPMVIADALGDGHEDIVLTTTSPSNQVVIVPGHGDGTFGAPKHIPLAFQPAAVAVGDVNGDGDPDLVLADASGNAYLMFGQGGGAFGAPSQISLGSGVSPDAIAVAQLTRSGHADLVVADQGGERVFVLLGNGDGTFRPGSTIPLAPSFSFGLSIAVADLNRDGVPDLLIGGGSAQALIGRGDGTFIAEPAISNTGAVALGDFTGNGIPDLAGLDTSYGNQIVVWPGLGNGTFGQPIKDPFVDSLDPYDWVMASADFNGDGRPDLAVAQTNLDGTSANVAVLLNQTGANAATPMLTPEHRSGCYVRARSRTVPDSARSHCWGAVSTQATTSPCPPSASSAAARRGLTQTGVSSCHGDRRSHRTCSRCSGRIGSPSLQPTRKHRR